MMKTSRQSTYEMDYFICESKMKSQLTFSSRMAEIPWTQFDGVVVLAVVFFCFVFL